MSTPEVIERPAQPYVGLTGHVTMSSIHRIGELMPPLFAFLAARGITPVDPPFWKYNVLDMERELEIEAGVPIAEPVEGADGVSSGVLPAGRYVSVTHVGHPDELEAVTGDLLRWADEQGLRFDRADSPAGDAWACRLEIYKSDPEQEPDMTKWETELAFKLAD